MTQGLQKDVSDDKGVFVVFSLSPSLSLLPLTKDAGFFSHFFYSLLALFVILQPGGRFFDVIPSPFFPAFIFFSFATQNVYLETFKPFLKMKSVFMLLPLLKL